MISPTEDEQNERWPRGQPTRPLVLPPRCHVASLEGLVFLTTGLAQNDLLSLQQPAFTSSWLAPEYLLANIISPVSFSPECWGKSSSLECQQRTFWGLDSSPWFFQQVHTV